MVRSAEIVCGVRVTHVVTKAAPKVDLGADAKEGFEQAVRIDPVVPRERGLGRDLQPCTANVAYIVA